MTATLGTVYYIAPEVIRGQGAKTLVRFVQGSSSGIQDPIQGISTHLMLGGSLRAGLTIFFLFVGAESLVVAESQDPTTTSVTFGAPA